MALRDELKRALFASWNTGNLSVYADHLQALDDPRGELIALDLAPREAPGVVQAPARRAPDVARPGARRERQPRRSWRPAKPPDHKARTGLARCPPRRPRPA